MIFLSLFLSFIYLVSSQSPCSNSDDADYDYVVVGSGPFFVCVGFRFLNSRNRCWWRTRCCSPSRGRIFRYVSTSPPIICSLPLDPVLVVDVGHDVNNYNTTIPLYFVRSVEGTDFLLFQVAYLMTLFTPDPALELAYTLDEYPPDFKYQKNDAWYPRARALGGSTVLPFFYPFCYGC